MKRILLILVAVFMASGMIMAQEAQRGKRKADPKVRAERMTERMAKEYSLNDMQKKQLLEANLELTEKMGVTPMRRPGVMRKGKKMAADSCTCAKAAKKHRKNAKMGKKGKKVQWTEEQRAEMKAKMEKRREEMKTAHMTYDAKLQKIMTKEQYEAYTKKRQEMKAKREAKREAGKEMRMKRKQAKKA